MQQRKTEGEQEIVLKLLEQIESDCNISQARFATQIGIAKGLANLYFNRCLQKGWIKLRHVPRRRYLYYLTPKGFFEKARLTSRFLSYFYQFYKETRADLVDTLRKARGAGCRRIAVLGAGELAEIAAIVGDEAGMKVVGFVVDAAKGETFLQLPLVRRWSDLPVISDSALLGTLEDARLVYSNFRRDYPTVPIYVPSKLQALIHG